MKYFLLSIFICFSKLVFSQIREFYSGASFTNYFWTPPHSEMNQFKYLTGFQLGYMASPKLKIFRFLTSNRISPYTAVEYANSNILLSTENRISLHSVRGSFPVRIKLIKDKENLKSINALIEPGVNLNFLQQNSSRSDLDLRINSLTCFMNVGMGTTFNRKVKDVEKAGYKFVGFSLYANKVIPIHVMKVMSINSSGVLDQVRINLGLRFSYQEPPKKGSLKKYNNKKKKN